MAIKHYSGKIGTFDYDDEMFEICKFSNNSEYLCFKDNYVGPIDLPKGIIDCSYMFQDARLEEGCYLRDFDTSDVIDMHSMFENCLIEDGFTLGENFNTSNVKDMSSMFAGCDAYDNKSFTLGNKFNTSNVKNMNDMFGYYIVDYSDEEPLPCRMPENFNLGNNFNTSNVKYMDSMFAGFVMPKNFTLGDKFDTSKVINMMRIFAECVMPDNFTLGNKFDISSAKNLIYMFNACHLARNFSFGEKFNFAKNAIVRVKENDYLLSGQDITGIFADCFFPLGFKFDDKLHIEKFDPHGLGLDTCRVSIEEVLGILQNNKHKLVVNKPIDSISDGGHGNNDER